MEGMSMEAEKGLKEGGGSAVGLTERSALREIPNCDYCGNPAEKVKGTDIYPHRPDLHHKRFYRCLPCNAYVGCHARSGEAFGRLANAELRAAKVRAHGAFDPLWEEGKFSSRTKAYAWLASAMGLTKDECHIGMFDLKQCAQVVAICRPRTRTKG